MLAAVVLALAGLTAASGVEPDFTSMSLEALGSVDVPTVYAASKHEQKITDAPASVSIITADDFRKYGYRNLAEALRSVPGLYVTYDRNYSAIGVRGFNRPGDINSRLLVLVDGHRVTENIYDSSYVGNDFIVDADLIDRVEIIRGPGSSLYGSNAFFGVINVVTKRGQALNGVEASADAGSFKTYKGRVSFGRSFTNGVDVLVSGAILDSAGAHSLYYPEFDTPQLNNGLAIDSDDERAYNALATVGWKDFTFQAAYYWREKGVPTASFDSYFGDPRERTTDSLGYVDLKFERELENAVTVLARVNFNRYKYDGVYPIGDSFADPPVAIVINKDDVLGQWLGAELQVSRTFHQNHKLTAGTEYRANLNQDVLNYDVSPPFVYSDLHRTSSNWSVFAQYEWTLARKLILNAGARYDHYDSFGGTFNPRAALVYHPWEKTGFKLLYGTAFRAPNVWEAFVEDPATQANPSLRPETIGTLELAYDQQLPHGLALRASAYRSRIDDLINQRTDPDTGLEFSDNIDGAEARGIELELSGHTAGGLRGRFSYALQRTKDAATGATLDNSPTHLAKANLVVPAYRDKLFVGLELQASSAAKTLAGSKADPFWLANVTLFSHPIAKGLEISGSIYNLFDERYGFPGGGQHVQDVIEQDGRTFRVKATWRF